MILKLNNRLVDLWTTPLVMGVINLTPDSFYDKSRILPSEDIVTRVEAMILEGVDIIDLGAASSRPGAEAPSIHQEINQLTAALELIRARFPEIPISIDTYRSDVLRQCLPYSIQLVNDISAGNLDPEFLQLIGEHRLPYVLMHMRGVPATMQQDTKYDDLIWEMVQFFVAKIRECHQQGIKDIILDPGFGFGKSLDDNYKLVSAMSSFRFLDRPLLVGLSRKSFIYKHLDIEPGLALNGTTALHMMALQNGASILRVHDVKEAKECIKLWSKYSSHQSLNSR